MQILINIDDDVYDHIKNSYIPYNGMRTGKSFMAVAYNAIIKGTPLPKGHGRLIDGDKFLKDNEAYTGWILDSSDWGGKNAYKDTLEDLVNDADTIIEADRSRSEE